MPRFKVQEQQTIAQAAPATAAAFGAGTGAAIAQAGGAVSDVGNALAEIEQRSKMRADVIDRVRQQNIFEESAMGLRQEVMDTEDMSDPAVVGVFKQRLSEQMNAVMEAHKGLPGSKEQLRASLENSAGQYIKQITADQIKAQQFMIVDNVKGLTNRLASVTTEAPDVLEDALEELDVRIDELSPALTKEQEVEYRRQGRETILTGAIGSYLERGDYQSAKALMDSKPYAEALSPATSRKLRMDVAEQASEARAQEQAFNDKVAKFTALTKRNLTPEEMARVKLLPAKKDMTTADKIAEYELVTGEPAPQSVVDDMYNIDAGSNFGNSLRGRALETINSGLNSYSRGTLSQQEAVEFQSAVYEAYGVKEYTDPVTGARTRSQPSMPPAVRQALETGAATYGTVDPGVMGSEPAPAGTQPMDALEGTPLWDEAEFVSGPFSAAERTIYGLTGEGDPRSQRAASAARWLQENIVRGIRPEGKIADQYRQELMSLVNIEPKVFENDMAYRTKLADMDTKLRDRLTELRSIADGEVPSTVQERRDAITLSNNIQQALARLQVRRVKTPDDAMKLAPGTWFVNPKGEVLQVPEQQGVTDGE